MGHMACIRRKQDSKYWFACFTNANGTRAQRSTKETDRKNAQKLADRFEEAARGRVTARQAQRVICEIFRRVNGSSLPSTSIRDYFESWLARKDPETARSTHVFYTAKARHFLGWLGDRAVHQLFTISAADVVAFRATEATRVNSSTVNHAIKVLRMIFEDAKRDGILADNPADGVKAMKRTSGRSRRAR